MTAAAALGGTLVAAVFPASADERTITVTLLGGRTITLPLQVPPGTPLDRIQLPAVETPIVAIASDPDKVPAADVATAESRKRARRRAARRAARRVAAPPVKARRAPKPERRRAVEPPTRANPTFSLALPGPAPIGVPDFFIDKFAIPPFLLPIYQAAGIEYGVRWELLAAINEIETDYGRNLRVSHAGAVGWMQFLPSTWRKYGVDANNDGDKDPYNPVDAIFSAARYLRAAGVERDPRAAIFAYNHADWYVDSILLRASMLGSMPSDLVGSLTGLTQGRFPVRARAKYAAGGHATNVFARAGSPVVAVQDGKIVRIGRDRRLGRFLVLRDAYGNTYTYGHLDKLARTSPSRERSAQSRRSPRGSRKERLFAHRAGGAGSPPLSAPAGRRHKREAALRSVRRGRRVVAGTVFARVAQGPAPHIAFAIRPAGRGTPRIDPKPILDGWKLLESTALYRAARTNPLVGHSPSIGQIMLMSKATLIRRVLADPRIEVYDCGREDIRAGVVDRRVLATLAFLAASGLRPTVTALRCGHGYYTKSGNVSEHSFGTAVDIAKINGIPILGNQGQDSIADLAVRRLLTLQGAMKPHQIITLMTYTGADNTIAMADHADHIHVGFRPLYAPNTRLGRQLDAVLKPDQWLKLIDRINAIENPTTIEARPIAHDAARGRA